MFKSKFLILLLPIVCWSAFAQDNCQVQTAAMKKRLENSAHEEKIWANSWGFTWLGLTTLQLAIIPFDDNTHDRIDLAFGAANAALGLIPTFLWRPYAIRAWNDLESVEPSCTNRYKFEKALQQDIEDKLSRNSELAHFSNILINLTLGTVQFFAFREHVGALLTVGLGVPIGELMLFTQPNHLPYEFQDDKKFTLTPWINKDRQAMVVQYHF